MNQEFKNILLSFVLISCTSMVSAGVVPGSRAKVDQIPRGYPVRVELSGGEKMNCTFERLAEDEILVTDEGGDEKFIPKVAIKKLTSQARSENDGLSDGALAGSLIGGLLPILSAAVAAEKKEPLVLREYWPCSQA